MRCYLIFMFTLLLYSCGDFSNNIKNQLDSTPNDSNDSPQSTEFELVNEEADNSDSPQNQSKEQPYYRYHNDDGEVWISHSQEEEDEYQMIKAKEAHYKAMEEQQRKEVEEERNDFHNWEDETVSNFYAEFQAYDDDDAEEKHYFYKKVNGRYFYEINLGFDTYEVEIEYKLANKFYKLKGGNVFLNFTFEPYLYKSDEGVLDCAGGRGTYYKKPD